MIITYRRGGALGVKGTIPPLLLRDTLSAQQAIRSGGHNPSLYINGNLMVQSYVDDNLGSSRVIFPQLVIGGTFSARESSSAYISSSPRRYTLCLGSTTARALTASAHVGHLWNQLKWQKLLCHCTFFRGSYSRFVGLCVFKHNPISYQLNAIPFCGDGPMHN
ncbi:hypothetical protein TNCV_2218111 [Trichonephila clavipes]|nr:hypothetical protein TNCV_2218111 [Trichonephila clavipes]